MDYSENNNKRRKRNHHPHITRLRNTFGILIFRVIFAFVLIGGFAAAGAVIGIYLGILRNAPEINIQHDLRSGVYNTFIIEARTGQELARLSGDENREFAPISRMPQHLKDAFVAIEDERFFSHNGVDTRGIFRALHVNFTTDRTEGASTITQQLIKNILGLARNDLISKLQEQYLAIQFERALIEQHGSQEVAKEVILEAYLNMINLGRNWHGVQVAAWNYFGKDVSELTLSESAVIAAITRNPSRYLPDRFPENNRYRQVLVLRNMLRLEMITEREYRMAINDPVHDRVQSGMIALQQYGVVHSYFIDALITQVVDDLVEQHFMTREQAFATVFGGGLRIYATQDMRVQNIIDNVFEDESVFPVGIFEIHLEYRLSARNEITNQISNHHRTGVVRNQDQVATWVENTRAELLTANDVIVAENVIEMPQPQAAFVLMDHHNGHVLGISGGRGEKTGNRHFCRATVATRSPGSQFKVVGAFLPGVDRGVFSAATHIVDQPWTFNDGHTPFTPRNWWGSNWEGPSSVRRAIYRSMNVVSAKAFQEVGPEVVFDYLINLGFTTLEGTLSNGREFRDTNAAVPLGGLTLGVTQLELAGSYAAIANLGEFNRPVFYTRVLDQNGRVILENGHNPRRVIRPPAAYLLTDMMRDTVRGVPGATGGLANFRNLRMPIAGKTGTSQRVEDQGFTGYTPYFTASVWLGFDTPRELRGVNNAHLVIWRNIMEQVHVELELPHRDFPRPDGVVTGSICRVSNLLPSDLCRRAGTVVTDLFVAGTLPTAHCVAHQETWICSLSGLLITDNNCPPGVWTRGVGMRGVCPYHGPAGENYHAPDWSDPPDWFPSPDLPGQPPGGGFWDLSPGPQPTAPPDVPWWEVNPEVPDTPSWWDDGGQQPQEPAAPDPPETPDIPDTPWWEDQPPDNPLDFDPPPPPPEDPAPNLPEPPQDPEPPPPPPPPEVATPANDPSEEMPGWF